MPRYQKRKRAYGRGRYGYGAKSYGRGRYGPRATGRGKFNFKKIARWGLRLGGAALGAYKSKTPEGALAGYHKGANLSKAVGLGKYRGVGSNMNQLFNGSRHAPMTVNSSKKHNSGDVIITHREFVRNITVEAEGLSNGSPFVLQRFAINPALRSLFPWLSQIAQNYTLYEIQGCVMEYRPLSGDNSVTQQQGKIIMCTDYDPNSTGFTSDLEMANYEGANSAKPSESLVHGVETHPAQQHSRMLYTRTGPDSKSRTDTDIGVFNLATVGIPSAAAGPLTLGELWVTYKVKLSRTSLYGSVLGNGISTFVGYTEANGNNCWENNEVFSPPGARPDLWKQGSTKAMNTNQRNTLKCKVTSAGSNTNVRNDVEVAFPTDLAVGTYRVQIAYKASQIGDMHIVYTQFENCDLANLKSTQNAGGAANSQVFMMDSNRNSVDNLIDSDVNNIDGGSPGYVLDTIRLQLNAPGSAVAKLHFRNVSSTTSGGQVSVGNQLWVYVEQINSEFWLQGEQDLA